MPEHGPDPVLAPASAMVVAVYAHPGDTVARGAPIVAVAGSGAVVLRQALQDATTLAKAANQRADRDRLLYSDGIISLARLEQSNLAAALASGQLASQGRLVGDAQFDAGGRLLLRAPRAGAPQGRVAEAQYYLMLARLVAFALSQRLLVLLSGAALLVAGGLAYRSLPVDAFPDVSPTQVKLVMKAPGMTPVSGGGTNVGALVTHHTLVRQAASGETSDAILERMPRVGSR